MFLNIVMPYVTALLACGLCVLCSWRLLPLLTLPIFALTLGLVVSVTNIHQPFSVIYMLIHVVLLGTHIEITLATAISIVVYKLRQTWRLATTPNLLQTVQMYKKRISQVLPPTLLWISGITYILYTARVILHHYTALPQAQTTFHTALTTPNSGWINIVFATSAMALLTVNYLVFSPFAKK